MEPIHRSVNVSTVRIILWGVWGGGAPKRAIWERQPPNGGSGGREPPKTRRGASAPQEAFEHALSSKPKSNHVENTTS